MATAKKLFSDALVLGTEAAKKITDPHQKAMAFASLASAIAQSGLLSSNPNTEMYEGEATTATPVATTAKEAIKPQAAKPKAATPVKKETPAPVVEEDIATEEPETTEEIELTEEWNDEALNAKKEQVEFIQSLKTEYEEEALNGCVKQFSEGQMNSLDEISPLNIDAFVAYIQALMSKTAE